MAIAKSILTALLAASLTPAAHAVEVGTSQAGTDEGWIEGKLQSMTLREKIGQMLMVDLSHAKGMTPDLEAHLSAGEFGNVIFFERNLGDETQARVFTRQLQDYAVVRTGVPLLTAVDQEGGLVNRLGGFTGMGMTKHSARTLGDVFRYKPAKATKLLDELTAEVAERMRLLGFNMNLAPVLDLTNDKRSYIYDRSFGGDPQSVAQLAANYTRVMRQHGIITTGKHFPNLSQTVQDSHRELPTLDRTMAQLEKHELVPFKKLKGELGAIMVGHVLVPDLDKVHPASVSPAAVRAIRERVGFNGVIVSDDLKMKALSDRYPLYEMVLRSVFAGVDMLIIAWDRDKQLEAARVLERAVKRGKLPVARIDESVRRILALKYRYAR